MRTANNHENGVLAIVNQVSECKLLWNAYSKVYDNSFYPDPALDNQHNQFYSRFLTEAYDLQKPWPPDDPDASFTYRLKEAPEFRVLDNTTDLALVASAVNGVLTARNWRMLTYRINRCYSTAVVMKSFIDKLV